MEVRYRRELSDTFLILEGAEQPDVYTARILKENRMGSILPGQIHWAEGRPEYWFSVSGCQTLRRLWESRQLQAEEVRELLLGIHRGLEQMEEYLLDFDRVLLEPDFLFVPEAGAGQVRLCCHPGWKGDFFEKVRLLVQYFLNKMDHGDSASVEMAYRLFQVVGKEFFCFEELLEAMEMPGQPAEKAPEDAPPWEPQEDWPEPEAGEALTGRRAGKAPRRRRGACFARWGGLLAIPAVAAVFGLLYHLKLWQPPEGPAALGLLLLSIGLAGAAALFLQRREKRNAQKRKTDSPGVEYGRPGRSDMERPCPGRPHREHVSSGQASGREKSWWKRSSAAEKPYCSGKQEERLKAQWDGKETVTEFLEGGFEERVREHCLISQNSLRHDTIRIRQTPFIIGKMEDVCDGLLREPTVSRIHARLEQQDGQIYLVDCNSTNGTFLNGVRLEPNRRYPVQAGDEIMLSDLKYLFQ